MPAEITHNRKSRPGRSLQWIFQALLLVPALTVIIQRDTKFPVPQSIHAALTLAPDLKHYFASEFSLRNRLAGLNHQTMHTLNGGRSIDALAQRGEDGWLFFSNIDRNHAELGIPTEQLRRTIRDIVRKNEICKSLGVVYIPLSVPSKLSVYHELLPDRMRRQMGIPGAVTEWHRYWSTKAVGIRSIDLLTPMRTAKQHAPVYFKTDSHWSEYGAYVAAEEILGELRKTNPSLPAPYRESPVFSYTKCEPGNEARMLGIESLLSESYVKLKLPESRALLLNDGTAPEIHAINLTGAIGKVMRIRCPQGEMQSAIVFNNSFGVALIPYLPRYFRESRFAWLGFSEAMVREHRPTVVVELFTHF